MDADQIDDLITLVQERPALWRKEDKNYSNRMARKLLMEEICKATGFSADLIAKKIKTLKDRMRICINKLPKTSSGTPDFDKSTGIVWPYYTRMMFMKDQFVSYSKSTTSDGGNDTSSMGQLLQDDDLEILQVSPRPTTSAAGSLSSRSSPEPQSWSRSGSSAKHLQSQNDFFELERRRFENVAKYVELNSKKDDLSFFMADIINDLRTVRDPLLKIQTKSKIRRVVEDAMMAQLDIDRNSLSQTDSDTIQIAACKSE